MGRADRVDEEGRSRDRPLRA